MSLQKHSLNTHIANSCVNWCYKEESFEEQLIKAYLKPGPEHSENHKPILEISKLLKDKEPGMTMNLNPTKMGQALRKFGHIIKLLVELVDPQLGHRIADPACGTGGFLLRAYQYMITQIDKDS